MIVVLFSGGIDSLVHLRWAMAMFGPRQVMPVYFDAGQSYAQRELIAARKVTASLNTLPLEEVKLRELYEDKVTGQVTLRNLMFLLHTATWPLCRGVVFGMLKAEAPVDKNKRFVRDVQNIIDRQFAPSPYQKERREFKIYTPFADMTKTQMLRWYTRRYNEEGIYDTIACYTPSGDMCGACISCFNRWLAFDRVGLMPEKYIVHPAQAMIDRVSKMYNDRSDHNWNATGLRQAWARRQWLVETYQALNAYTWREHYKGNVLKVVLGL